MAEERRGEERLTGGLRVLIALVCWCFRWLALQDSIGSTAAKERTRSMAVTAGIRSTAVTVRREREDGSERMP